MLTGPNVSVGRLNDKCWGGSWGESSQLVGGGLGPNADTRSLKIYQNVLYWTRLWQGRQNFYHLKIKSMERDEMLNWKANRGANEPRDANQTETTNTWVITDRGQVRVADLSEKHWLRVTKKWHYKHWETEQDLKQIIRKTTQRIKIQTEQEITTELKGQQNKPRRSFKRFCNVSKNIHQ